jgi:hypothetical protein
MTLTANVGTDVIQHNQAIGWVHAAMISIQVDGAAPVHGGDDMEAVCCG